VVLLNLAKNNFCQLYIPLHATKKGGTGGMQTVTANQKKEKETAGCRKVRSNFTEN